VQPISIVGGSVQLLLNPGGAVDGLDWTALLIGTHERHDMLDREGARDSWPATWTRMATWT